MTFISLIRINPDLVEKAPLLEPFEYYKHSR